MKTLVAKLASRLGWIIIGLVLIGPISGCLESDEPAIVPGAGIIRIPELEGNWTVRQGTVGQGYMRFDRDNNNHYTYTDLQPDDPKQKKSPFQFRFLPLQISDQNRKYFLGITETVDEKGAQSKPFYSELQWTGEQWTWGIYELKKDATLYAAAEGVAARKGLSITKFGFITPKLNGSVNSQTLQALFSDTTFRNALELQSVYTLLPLSPDDKQRLSAAGYELAASTGTVTGVPREKAAEPLSASSTQALLKQLETKIGTGGPFDRDLFERTAAALGAADPQSATLQELLENIKDFVTGKIRASLFVSYLRETLPALARTSLPASRGAAWLAEKGGTGDLWATFFLARAHYYAARREKDTQRFEQFEGTGFPEMSRPYWQASQEALRDNNFNGSFAEARKLAEQGVIQGFAPLIGLAAILKLSGEAGEKNEAEGLRLLRLAAAEKFPMAMANLGFRYATGNGVPKDSAQALQWYRQAAELGHANAMFFLGVAYATGDGVPKDRAQALQWYRQAAERGLAGAMFNLGVAYGEGNGVSQDRAQALQWYRQAAERGHAGAMFNLGVAYDKGNGVSQDRAQALQWYRQAAERGQADAMFNLGVAYAQGDGVAKDRAQALQWYRQAADRGQADAMLFLGVAYATGDGVPKDRAQALQWYRQAAERGDAGAMFNLGVAYAKGDGVAKDPAQALQWYHQAAERGHAGAMVNLGVAYDDGNGVAKDPAQALQWYRQAAERGHAGAMFNLGVAYAKGDGVAKDPAQALQWYRQAAERGDAGAMFLLGIAYDDGNGVPKDRAQALQWYRQAAERGHANAMVILGAAYVNGNGVPKDSAQALQWYRQAAERGHAGAMFLLGIAYDDGDGVSKDTSIALEWLDKAAKLGHEKAQNLAAKLRRSTALPGARPLNAKEWGDEFRNARYVTEAELLKSLPPVRLEIIFDTSVDHQINQDSFRAVAQSLLQDRGLRVDQASAYTFRINASVPVNKKLVRESSITGGGRMFPETHQDEFPLIVLRVGLEIETVVSIHRYGKFYYRPVVIADIGTRMINAGPVQLGEVVNRGKLKEAIELAFSAWEASEDADKLAKLRDAQRWQAQLWNPAEDERLYREYMQSLSPQDDDTERVLSGVVEVNDSISCKGKTSSFVDEGTIHRLTTAELSRARINESSISPVKLIQTFKVEKWRVEAGLFRWQDFGLLSISQVARQQVVFRLGNELVRSNAILFGRDTIEASQWDDADGFIPGRIGSAVQDFVKEVRFRK